MPTLAPPRRGDGDAPPDVPAPNASAPDAIAPGPAGRATPHNVPPVLSSFVGRAEERAGLAQALVGGARLVTLTGPGGAGKTRLAREIAADLLAAGGAPPFPGGIWWVELAPVTDGDGVAPAVAAAIGVNPGPGRPVLDAVAEALGVGAPGAGRRTLLVLDNGEHVVDAAAALAEWLLRAAPGLTVLATSREALAVEGERAWVLPPLASPPVPTRGGPGAAATVTAAGIADFEAVRLFVERAGAASPTFALTDRTAPAVAAICARLDGLPLALELAAASVGTLGIEQVAARLDDALGILTRGRRTALPRHRTLQALLDWSHALLSPAERALLARLAVFRGPFSVDAVEVVGVGARRIADGATGAAAVADPVPDAATAVHALGRLVEQSLVEVREQQGETRLRLLETVRQYGLARLAADPADARATAERHARWVAALAAEAAPTLWSPARKRAIDRLGRSVDEIRGALDWAVGAGADPMLAARIAGALGWFWISGVPWREGRARLEAVLAAADAPGIADADRPAAETRALAAVTFPLSRLAYFAGDAEAARRAAHRGDALWQRALDAGASLARTETRGRAMLRQQLGLLLAVGGDALAGRRAADEAVALAAADGDEWLEAAMRARRPVVYGAGGAAWEGARAAYADAAARLRAAGDAWLLARCLYEKGDVELGSGDLAAAAASVREAVAVLHDEPDAWFLACALDVLAAIAAATDPLPAGRADTVARLLGAAAELRARSGAEVIEAERARQADTAARARAALGSDAFAGAWSAGAALDLAGVFALARDADLGRAAAPAPEEPVRPTPGAPRPSPVAAPRAPDVPDAPALAVRALGPLVVARHGVPLGAGELPGGKVTELLLYLVCHPEGRTKEEIGLALWPDASAAQVRGSFHVTLHRLRRALAGPRAADDGESGAAERAWIAVADGRYALVRDVEGERPDATRADAPAALVCDVDDLLAAADALGRAERRQRVLAPDELAAAAAALDGVRGALGQGLACGDWLVAHQDRLALLWGDAMQALARQHARAGRHAEGARVLGDLVARDPLRESAHRELMVLWAAAGERARALAHYDALAALLDRELGVAPSRETRGVADRIRHG